MVKSILDYFKIQVKTRPHETAVIFLGKKLTYFQLDQKSNQLANLLRVKNIFPDDVVGIYAERSFEFIIGILGIIKSGAAYLPLSKSLPIERVRYMLSDSGAKVLLAQNKFMDNFANGNINYFEVIDLDNIDGNYSSDPVVELHNPKSLVYVIYTSGTTGIPKGVMIEHRSLLNRIEWMQKAYPLYANDIILQKTPLVFDVSVWELFLWMIKGAKICFMTPDTEVFPKALIDVIDENKITVIHFVPSMLNNFLNSIKTDDDIAKISSLKYVFASGETLSSTSVRTFIEKIFAKNHTKLINLYGPTETTVDVSHFDCSQYKNYDRNPPIGKPIEGTAFWVVNDGKLQPTGEFGELYISGVCLARGYLNKKELTDEKFIDNSFHPGVKMYKTGDIVRMNSDGDYEYYGRNDAQVKINGLRIELEEIESHLCCYEGVTQSLVAVETLANGLKNLCAYYISDSEISIVELKKYLKKYLPVYMIPNSFQRVMSIPRTASGKIDREFFKKINLIRCSE